jgi:hypothetical protein
MGIFIYKSNSFHVLLVYYFAGTIAESEQTLSETLNTCIIPTSRFNAAFPGGAARMSIVTGKQ